MTTVSAKATISASPEAVFDAVSDIEKLPETFSYVTGVEFLTESRSGVGTRFKEHRLMKGREMVTELEVTEYDRPNRVRMIADSHGTIWDSLFTVRPAGDATELEITMQARAQRFLPKLLNPLFKGLFRSGLEEHVVEVKKHLEG